MKISAVKKKFKNTWVLAEVLKEDELNQPVDIKPIISNDDRNKVYEKIATLPKSKTYATILQTHN